MPIHLFQGSIQASCQTCQCRVITMPRTSFEMAIVLLVSLPEEWLHMHTFWHAAFPHTHSQIDIRMYTEIYTYPHMSHVFVCVRTSLHIHTYATCLCSCKHLLIDVCGFCKNRYRQGACTTFALRLLVVLMPGVVIHANVNVKRH